MISLRTGTPGACKTLSAVEALAKMLARWEKHPEEARPIFVHGVKDLALPHSPLPVKEWRESPQKPSVMVPDWDVMPDGSYVLVDEAQSFFPPRSSAATPPPHVAWLNTHRHRGFDIEVITQHPKLIDGSVRALVGKHQHFRRLFGRKVSCCYEWDACSDSLSGLANAVTSGYPFPKKAFAWYKSAEVHTKQSFRLPKWLLIPFIGVAIGLFAIPKAYSVLTQGIGGKGLNPAATISASTPSRGASAAIAAGSAPERTIREKVAEIIAPPKIAGCLASKSSCSCVNSEGKAAIVTEEACRVASTTLGGLIPYDINPRPEATLAAVVHPPGPLSSAADVLQPSRAVGIVASPQAEPRTIVRGSGAGGMSGIAALKP